LQSVVGQTASHQFSLHRRDGKEIEVRQITSLLGDLVGVRFGVDAADLRASWEEPVRGPAVIVIASLEPQAEKVRRTSGLQITTNHPDVPLLTVPLSVWVRDLIEAAPASLNLRGGAGGSRRSRAMVRLVHRLDVPFEIKGLEVSDPTLLSASLATSGAGSVHTIRVEVSTDLDLSVGQIRRGWLDVRTSDSDRAQIRVPVTVSGALVRPPSPPASAGGS
jgi:hypothetical protein